MRLREFIVEGGNLRLGDPEKGEPVHQADEIDLTIHNRTVMVGILNRLLASINQAFAKKYKTPLWSPELLASGQFLGGSSLHFANTKGISDDAFAKHKPKVGDIDTQCDKRLESQIEEFLQNNVGKRVGKSVFLGFSRGTEQLNGLFQLDDLPIKMQIDFEFGEYTQAGIPDEWFRFSHNSMWEDIEVGIKGVFHKFLYRALTAKTVTAKYIQMKTKLKGPIEDNDIAFAVASAGGGGLRQKYAPTGETKDGIPIVREIPTADSPYIQNLAQQFAVFFGRKPTKQDSQLQQSFVGTVDLMKRYLTPEEQAAVARAFIKICFGRGVQMITRDDPERDAKTKFVAIDVMLERLGLTGIKPEAIAMAKEYEAQYREKTGTVQEAEGDPKVKSRQSMPHIHNPGSSTEMKDVEFLDYVSKIKNELNGRLDGVQINLKVDGAGVRFGKNGRGEPFFATSHVGAKYEKDIGDFEKYNQDKGVTDPVILARSRQYDDMLRTVVTSDFIQVLPNDTVVQAEMLYNPMAEAGKHGLKFVNINYDPAKLGKIMTLVPFSVASGETGTVRPDSDRIIQALIGQSNADIKIASNALEANDIDVTAIIDPIVSLTPELRADLANRSKDPAAVTAKENARNFVSKFKKQFSDFIINHPNILGKDMLGDELEGLVLNLPGFGPVKITSQLMKVLMAKKQADRAAGTGSGIETIDKTPRTAVVAIGNFAGHIGHEQLINYAIAKAKELNGTPFVFVGHKVGKDDPIDIDTKIATLKKLFPGVSVSVVENQLDPNTGEETVGNIFKKIEYELVKKPPYYNNIVITVGSDQTSVAKVAASMQARYAKFAPLSHVRVSAYVTPREASAGGTGVSTTALRNALKDMSQADAFKVWSKAYNVKKLGANWIVKLMAIARQNMGIAEPVAQPAPAIANPGAVAIPPPPKKPTPVMEFIEDLESGRPGAQPHPEDSIFDGAQAAHTMLNALMSAIADHKGITIKWDGFPALIFGRLSDGRFTIQDKYMFEKKQFADSPQAWQKYDTQKATGKQRPDLYPKLAALWKGLDESVGSSPGFFWGDLLWSQPLTPTAGKFAFKPNIVEYRVDVNSPAGKLAAGKTGGVVVHQYYTDETAEPAPWNGKGLTPSRSVGIFNPNLGISFKLNEPVQLVKAAKNAVVGLAETAGSFIDSLDSNTKKALKTYANKKITGQPTDEYEEIVQGCAGEGLNAVFAIWRAIYALKANLAQQLEQQVQGMEQSVDGRPGGEGFVINTPHGLVKLVNRGVFSATLFANRP